MQPGRAKRLGSLLEVLALHWRRHCLCYFWTPDCGWSVLYSFRFPDTACYTINIPPSMWSNSAESAPPQSLQLAACQQSQLPALLFWWSQAASFDFRMWHAAVCEGLAIITVALPWTEIYRCVFVPNQGTSHVWKYEKWKDKQSRNSFLLCLCSFHEGLGLYLFGRPRISFRFFSGWILSPMTCLRMLLHFGPSMPILKKKRDQMFQPVENRGPWGLT